MTDYQYAAELELNIADFNRNAQEAQKALTGLERAGYATSDTVTALQKSFNFVASSARDFTNRISSTGEASASSVRIMANLVRQIEAVRSAMQSVNSQTFQSGLAQMNAQSSKQLNADEQAIRKRELADLRNDIQERSRIEREGRQRIIAQAISSEQQRVRDEKALRDRELSDLRAHIQERYRIMDDKAGQARQSLLQEERDAEMLRQRELADLRNDIIGRNEATLEAARAQDAFVNSLGNTRYALYEVATSLTVVSAATLGVVTAGTALSATFERAFADVERTSGAAGAQLQGLRDDLVALTTEMPTSFGDLTDIATLGGQLGIDAQNIAEFTRVVSQFAATTDVTVTAAAESMGRLAQLTETPQSEMQNLASAIYEVGINSVATESAILGVSQQIAVSANLAGFSADQTVALAGALASLGVAPEAARGSFMRIFNEIRNAVDAGGDSLDLFAHTAQMSGDEFAAAWRGDPQAAFYALIQGMEAAADRGENLSGILQDMGIWAVRDQRAIQLLADNTEVYAQAMADSTSAYAEGTALQEGYAVVAETTAEKINILLGTLKSLVAEGFGPMLDIVGTVVDVLQPLAEGLLSIAQTPAGGVIISLVAGLTALVGVAALAVAGWARFNAAMIGALTVTNEYLKIQTQEAATTLTINGLLKEQVGLLLGVARAKLGAAAASRTATAANTGYAASLGAASTGAGRAITAVSGFARVLGPASLALAAMGPLIATYIDQMSNVRSADSLFGAGSTGLEQAIKEDTAALREGGDAFRVFSVQVDETGERIAQNAKLFGTMGAAAGDSRLPEWVETLEDSTGAQVNLGDETEATTGKIRNQMIAIGDASKQYIADTLANDEAFQDFWKNAGDSLARSGINIRDLLEESLKTPGGGSDAIQGYIDEVTAQLNELGYVAKTNNPFNQDADGFMAVAPEDKAAVFELLDQWSNLYLLLEQFSAVDTSIGDTVSNISLKTQLYSALGIEMDETADSAGDLEAGIASLAEGLFDAIGAQAAFSDALFGLHEALAENGNDFSAFTQGGIANINALQRAVEAAADQAGTDIGQFGTNLANIFAQMEGAGYTAGSELDFLRTQLVNTFNQQYGLDLDISNARGSIHQFIADAITALQVRAQIERRTVQIGRGSRPVAPRRGSNLPDPADEINESIRELQALQGQLQRAEVAGRNAGNAISDGMKKSGGAAKKAAKDAKDAADEIYTLLDYASDLSSIFDRALDLRFGNQNARDDTASILQDMRDKAEDAAKSIRDLRQKIRELRADLGTLAADRNTLQFQLGVAMEYGDELRATEIRAELAKNSADAADKQNDLKDAQKDLEKEQDAASKSLEGNTEGARDNRKVVQDLLGSYRQQLVTLAENGASQDELKRKSAELKREFQQQLTQMGYNRNEVEKYARAFDDFSHIIQNVPRNITVTATANTNPATQALNEWIAKNKNKTINVKTTASTPSVGGTVRGGSWAPSSVSVGTGGVSTKGMSVGGTISSSYLKATRSISSPYINVTRGMAGGTRLAGGGEVGYHARGGVHGFHPGAPKGTDTTPAWLTPGEYVQRKKAVDYYGVPFMNAINSLKFPRYMSSGGLVPSQPVAKSGNGIQLVELLPQQLRAIVQASAEQAAVIISNDTIARAANTSNARSAARGSN